MEFWKPDFSQRAPLDGAPDFHVLLAGLSARQAVSVTVKLQATLERGTAAAPLEAPLVGLFAAGERPDPSATNGSFTPSSRAPQE